MGSLGLEPNRKRVIVVTPPMSDTDGAGAPSSSARIVTVTMNPALDIATSTEVVMPTDKIRCGAARYDPGGGGINVALVACALGAPVVAMFPAGGASGDLVTEMLDAAGLPLRRIRTAEATRESFTVNECRTERQYRFVLPGPAPSAAEQEECLHQLRSVAASADYVVASGSLPPNVSPDFYNRIADVCAQLDTRLILDTSGGGLQHLPGATSRPPSRPSTPSAGSPPTRPVRGSARRAHDLLGTSVGTAVHRIRRLH